MVSLPMAYLYFLLVLQRGLGLVHYLDCCQTGADSTGLMELLPVYTVAGFRCWQKETDWTVLLPKAHFSFLSVFQQGFGFDLFHQGCCQTEVDSTGLMELLRFLTVVGYRCWQKEVDWMVLLPTDTFLSCWLIRCFIGAAAT